MRREVSTIRPIAPTPRGDAAWFAQSAQYPPPILRALNTNVRADARIAEDGIALEQTMSSLSSNFSDCPIGGALCRKSDTD